MTVLFKEGIPAQDTPIRSVEIRDNFSALYDKLKTLEARATSPESTQILVNGGPVYFRAGNSLLFDKFGAPISGAQQLVLFQTSLIDLATANGFRTIKNPNGTLSKEAVYGGISPFESTGLFREILITLNNQGRLSFTEGATTTTGLSRPFDIAFDDSEVPICLVVVQQSGQLLQSGQLAAIRQIDLTDVRPVITTAFQNNLAGAELQQNVLDNQLRIEAMERSSRSTDTLKVQIPSVEKLTLDGTRTTNKKLEILSGSTYINGQQVKYAGGLIDVTQDLTSPLPVDNFAVAFVALNTAGSIVLYHGTPSDSSSDPELVQLPAAVQDGYGNLTPPADVVPLALVYYRMNSVEDVPLSGTTLQIKPIVSEIFVDPTFDVNSNVTGGIRFAYAFDIVAINSPTEFVVNIPTDVTYTSVFLSGQLVDLVDDNTRPFRRTISNNPQGTYSPVTRNMTIIVSETFVNDVSFPNTSKGISLKRNPKAVAVSNKPGTVLEDVRPFVTEL